MADFMAMESGSFGSSGPDFGRMDAYDAKAQAAFTSLYGPNGRNWLENKDPAEQQAGNLPNSASGPAQTSAGTQATSPTDPEPYYDQSGAMDWMVDDGWFGASFDSDFQQYFCGDGLGMFGGYGGGGPTTSMANNTGVTLHRDTGNQSSGSGAPTFSEDVAARKAANPLASTSSGNPGGSSGNTSTSYDPFGDFDMEAILNAGLLPASLNNGPGSYMGAGNSDEYDYEYKGGSGTSDR
jgi:hypothetical protein